LRNYDWTNSNWSFGIMGFYKWILNRATRQIVYLFLHSVIKSFMNKYEIHRGSYEEHYKFYNELCKTLPENHPKRVKMLEEINKIAERMNEALNSL